MFVDATTRRDLIEFYTDSSVIELNYVDGFGVPLDLSGYTAEIVLKFNDVPVHTAQVTVAGINYNLSVTIPSSVNTALFTDTGGALSYALILTSPTNTQETILYGAYILVDHAHGGGCVPEIEPFTTQSQNIAAPSSSLPVGTSQHVRLEAGENISTFKPVIVENGLLYLADSNNPGHINKIIGITLESGVTGGIITVSTAGHIKNAGWSFSNTVIFLEGTSVSDTPPLTGFSAILGVAATPNSVILNLNQNIELL